jgi:hypothetical protein
MSRLPFGPLPVNRPLVLALTGWIHFGGGMANIAASLDPTLPFQGMDDQAYGNEPRPGRIDDSWIKACNTRWVGPVVVSPGGLVRATP